MQPDPRAAAVAAALLAFPMTPPAQAQGPAFETPGMPRFGGKSQASQVEATQTSRFSSVFNPAVFFSVDGLGDWRNTRGGSPDDGTSLELRTLEVGAMSWVDPTAWAYFNASTEGEELAVEEAALHYVGFDGNSTVRAGRFFLDFGKQMQSHVHHLRTIERPLVLRTLLGEEVTGDGVQWDHWTPAGDATVVRWSLGVFDSLLPHEDEVFSDGARDVADRRRFGNLHFSGRLTGFSDVGERSTLQVGTSARLLSDFRVEVEDAVGNPQTADDLSNLVLGADVTWGCTDETGQESWTAGAEYLVSLGDNGATAGGTGTPTVFDRTVDGYYVFADYSWERFESVGVQFSTVQLPDATRSRVTELETYYTHQLSEYQRLRLGVIGSDQDLGDRSLRVALQYTASVGAHGHGLNW